MKKRAVRENKKRDKTMQNNQHILSVKKKRRQSISREIRHQQRLNNQMYRIISLSIDNLIIHDIYLCFMRLSSSDNYMPDYSW